MNRAVFSLALAGTCMAVVAPASSAPDGFMATRAEGARVAFDAARGGNERWLAFPASADDRIAVDIVGSSYADACSVRLEILDARDRVIGRQSCAAGIGQSASAEAAATGLYRLHLVGRIGNAGALRVKVRTEARLDA
jgi:hypothetical protein